MKSCDYLQVMHTAQFSNHKSSLFTFHSSLKEHSSFYTKKILSVTVF